MKYRFFIVFLGTTLHTLSPDSSCDLTYKCVDCKPPREQKQTNSEETARVVVANFLTMLAQLLMMAQNPKDQQLFTTAIMGIAQGLGNIAIEASKRPKDGQCDNGDNNDNGLYDTVSKELYLKNDPLPEEIHELYVRYAEHFDTLND